MSRLTTRGEIAVPVTDLAESLRALVSATEKGNGSVTRGGSSPDFRAIETSDAGGTGPVLQPRDVRARSIGPAAPETTSTESNPISRPAHTIMVTSGKGGVGGSNFALNLAIALGELGKRVLLVDADLGLSNIDILCGLTPFAGLGDVVSGSSSLAAALMEGPAGIKILAGSHGMHGPSEILGDTLSSLAEELADRALDSDYIIIDAGSGLGGSILTLAESSNEVVVVTTPEPTSIADAQAAFGRLRRVENIHLRLVVNQARSIAEGRSTLRRLTAGSREFFNTKVEPLGCVRFDRRVQQAVRERRPFSVASPNANASRDVRRIARDLVSESSFRGRPDSPLNTGFFSSLAARWDAIRISL